MQLLEFSNHNSTVLKIIYAKMFSNRFPPLAFLSQAQAGTSPLAPGGSLLSEFPVPRLAVLWKDCSEYKHNPLSSLFRTLQCSSALASGCRLCTELPTQGPGTWPLSNNPTFLTCCKVCSPSGLTGSPLCLFVRCCPLLCCHLMGSFSIRKLFL